MHELEDFYDKECQKEETTFSVTLKYIVLHPTFVKEVFGVQTVCSLFDENDQPQFPCEHICKLALANLNHLSFI